MSEWYLYQPDGGPGGPASGPWTSEAIAEAILSGNLPADCWVARPGASEWVRALAVPLIAQRIDGIPTRPRPDTPVASAVSVASVASARPPSDTLQMRVPPAMSVRFPSEDEDP